jgi:peptide-methionine (R)-S-oxide reductase
MNDSIDKNTAPNALPTTEAEWLEKLGPEAFAIMRKQGTERAFTGEFWD